LEDNDENTRVFASASRIQSPRIEANRLSQRQRRAGTDATASPVWAVIPSRGRSVSENYFDPEYAALRATVLSLARDGHHLLTRSARNQYQPDSRALRRLLQRIDRLDEHLAHRGQVPVQRWVHQLKRLLLDRAATHT
jgi:hypothetical protein